MTSYCICFPDWASPSTKIPDYAYAEFKKLLCLVIFHFNHSKNNAVLEPRTGHFRGLEGFEAKAKDLTFETKAKDFKMCPRGRPRGQGRP